MDLGLLYEIDCPFPWAGEHPWAQRTIERQKYRECLQQMVFADRMGFDTVWCVEHHFRESQSHMPCNDNVLAALSQVTERIKLGFGVTLAPHEFIHPARLAEKVATVDLLSQGRVQWGIGRSTPMEQLAFHVDVERSKEKMRAAVKTVTGMWSEEYYEEHSEFLDFPKRMVTPKPYQHPHPPIWMAGVSEGSAEQAASDGLGLLAFSIMQPLDKLQGVIDAYRAAQRDARPISGVHTNKVGVYTLVHCTDSRDRFEQDRVWDSMWWWYKSRAEFSLKWEMAHLSPEEQDKRFPLLQKQARGEFDLKSFDREDMVVVGTPDECLEKLRRYEAIGTDQVLCYVNFGYLPHEAVMRSLELLGTYVIPELQKSRGGAADLTAAVLDTARSADIATRRPGTPRRAWR